MHIAGSKFTSSRNRFTVLWTTHRYYKIVATKKDIHSSKTK